MSRFQDSNGQKVPQYGRVIIATPFGFIPATLLPNETFADEHGDNISIVRTRTRNRFGLLVYWIECHEVSACLECLIFYAPILNRFLE